MFFSEARDRKQFASERLKQVTVAGAKHDYLRYEDQANALVMIENHLNEEL
jgi:HD superfamily phosphohydrolase YqeK